MAEVIVGVVTKDGLGWSGWVHKRWRCAERSLGSVSFGLSRFLGRSTTIMQLDQSWIRIIYT